MEDGGELILILLHILNIFYNLEAALRTYISENKCNEINCGGSSLLPRHFQTVGEAGYDRIELKNQTWVWVG